MPTDPRSVAEAAAKELLRTLAGQDVAEPQRVSEVDGRLACLIVVWDAEQLMPTVVDERRRRDRERRSRCKRDILDLLAAAGGPLTRKEVVKALRGAKAGHGEGTIAKALADLTTDKELVNARDGRGYWLPEVARRWRTPSLF
jgi:hypothetical protein